MFAAWLQWDLEARKWAMLPGGVPTTRHFSPTTEGAAFFPNPRVTRAPSSPVCGAVDEEFLTRFKGSQVEDRIIEETDGTARW